MNVGEPRRRSSIEYDHETEIEWARDPSDLDYLREFSVDTRKRRGIPQSYERGYVVYGWANVDAETPTVGAGCVRKRTFVLKPTDRGGPRDDGTVWMNYTPAEAVAVDSIVAGEPSRKVNGGR